MSPQYYVLAKNNNNSDLFIKKLFSLVAVTEGCALCCVLISGVQSVNFVLGRYL